MLREPMTRPLLKLWKRILTGSLDTLNISVSICTTPKKGALVLLSNSLSHPRLSAEP